ncbi:hypothetical protein RHECIAT_CH0001028 [Rhizobium etli CIAT 652]|uniref:Uncharacterized protein n=1 Tax=Rhizobium etli (strain CIAT 652) TaxID=491916 RepID=B3PS91_RHIE6|nr:hypothetical protein RHECIAT_CH0001028 [Rhizobium etli CIAT 652]
MLFITLDSPCRSALSGWRQWLPLLTLSPLAGRGDVPCETSAGNGEVAAIPFSPRAGVRRTG